MLRTQIYIPENLHRTAKVIAKRKKEPLAKILRDFIARGVTEEKKSLQTRSLASLSGLKITGGPKDLSTHMDKYLYKE